MKTNTKAPFVSQLTRAEKLRLIEKAFSALLYIGNRTWSNSIDKLYLLCAEEERSHRGPGSEFARYHPGAVPVAIAARMFAVKRIAGYLSGDRMPRGADFLHTHKSCFQAAGIVDESRAEIRKAWKGIDVRELAALNYCEFVREGGAA